MTTTGFIFDMDGTMIDNMAWHERTWWRIFQEQDIVLDPERLLELRGCDNRQMYRALFGQDDPVAADTFGDAKEQRYRELYGPHLQPLPGLVDFLAACRDAQLALAVATSAIAANVDFILDGLGLRSYFQTVVGVEAVPLPKPAPDVYLEAARRLGLQPAQCLAFEDSASGIAAASSAGMPVVALTTSLTHEAALQAGACRSYPDFKKLRLAECLALLRA